MPTTTRSRSKSPPQPTNHHVNDKWAASHGTGDRNNAWGGVFGQKLYASGTIALLLTFPIIAVYMWHICEVHHGDLFAFVNDIRLGGFKYLGEAYSKPSFTGLTNIGVFGAIEAFLQLCLPGKTFYGPATPKGIVFILLFIDFAECRGFISD